MGQPRWISSGLRWYARVATRPRLFAMAGAAAARLTRAVADYGRPGAASSRSARALDGTSRFSGNARAVVPGSVAATEGGFAVSGDGRALLGRIADNLERSRHEPVHAAAAVEAPAPLAAELHDGAALLARFSAEWQALAGQVHQACTANEAAAIVAEICRVHEARTILAWSEAGHRRRRTRGGTRSMRPGRGRGCPSGRPRLTDGPAAGACGGPRRCHRSRRAARRERQRGARVGARPTSTGVAAAAGARDHRAHGLHLPVARAPARRRSLHRQFWQQPGRDCRAARPTSR